MTSPAQGLTHDWLTRLLGYSQQPGIAAAAPIILAPDGRIQHAGIAMPTGTPLHLLHGTRSSMDDFFGYGTSVYNVLALSGTAMIRRATLAAAGGLDPALGELAAGRSHAARHRRLRARGDRSRRAAAHHGP